MKQYVQKDHSEAPAPADVDLRHRLLRNCYVVFVRRNCYVERRLRLNELLGKNAAGSGGRGRRRAVPDVKL